MKKLGKVALSASIVLTGLSFGAVESNQQVTHAATTPYYTYNGYAGYNANFLSSSDFVRAVHYNNVTFNKIKLDLTPVQKGSKVVKTQSGKNVYDQNFGFYNKKKTAFTMSFPVKNKSLSIDSVKKAYKKYPSTYSSFNKEYAYNVNGHMIYFQTQGKYVSFVTIGNHG